MDNKKNIEAAKTLLTLLFLIERNNITIDAIAEAKTE
jgi:hypothetical protein